MEAVVFEGTLILVMGLHIELDQLENEAAPYFTLVATSESYLLLFRFVQARLTRNGRDHPGPV